MTRGTKTKGGGSRPSHSGRLGAIATGVLGVAVLSGLCVWQIQRLEWKESVIATLEARLATAPTPLPAVFDPPSQEFTRVRVTGSFDGAVGAHGYADAPLLVSLPGLGPGYRVIQPFLTSDDRRVMVDRGYVPLTAKNERGAASRPTPAPEEPVTLVGALRWPDEEAGGKPYGENDNVWTARDLPVMARLFDAEPVLIVAETSTAVGDWPIPLPIKAVNITNNHFNYAVTWGALALVWAVMTVWLAFFRPRPAG